MLLIAATKVVEVHCQNCDPGPDWWTKVSAIGTLVGLIIASVALWKAWIASRTADTSLKIASDALKVSEEQLAMGRLEHDEFLREIRASPDLRLTLVVRGATVKTDSDGQRIAVVEIAGRDDLIILEIGLRNVGLKAVTSPFMNVVVPKSVRSFMRVEQSGSAHSSQRPPLDTPETLSDGRGGRHPAQYLVLQKDSIPADGGYHVWFAGFYVEAPDSGDIAIPLVLRVNSADLPRNARNENEMEMRLLLLVRVV